MTSTELTCLKCGRAIAAGEPVWRASMGWRLHHRLGVRCGNCRPDPNDYPTRPTPCEACERPVFNRYSGVWRRHTYCDERCEVQMYRAAQRARRALARGKEHVCVCGRTFTTARRDARFCSPACKQRAHRYRKANVPPARHSTNRNAEVRE